MNLGPASEGASSDLLAAAAAASTEATLRISEASGDGGVGREGGEGVCQK